MLCARILLMLVMMVRYGSLETEKVLPFSNFFSSSVYLSRDFLVPCKCLKTENKWPRTTFDSIEFHLTNQYIQQTSFSKQYFTIRFIHT